MYADLQRPLIRRPPSAVTGELGLYLHHIADALHAFGYLSVFSWGNPNSNESALIGTIGVNINSAVTAKLWVKELGSGNTGWRSLTTHPLTSVRTAASVDSTNLAVNEIMFSLHDSGASLGVRSGGAIWYFASSMSTKG